MTQHYLQRELYEKIRTDPQVFEFLQSSSLDGLWYWDLENPENEWMNEAFWRLFGVDPEMKSHRSEEWQDIVHPDDLSRAMVNFERHIADPTHPYDQTVRYRHRDGSTVTVRCRGIALRDEDGRPTRMLGAHTDLTSLKKTEARLEAANRELAQQVILARAAALAKAGFLSTMSHEVRTPLNAILGFFQLLNASDVSERQRAWVVKGMEAAETLLGTLNHVLDASRLDAELVTPKASSVRLRDVACQMEACLEGGIAKAGKLLDYSVTLDPVLPERVSVDRLRLTQITNNLIDNAIKFTAEGAITVTLSPDPRASDRFVLEIFDTGIGIAPEDHFRIFKSFEQVNESVTRAFGGTGLGLSIAQDLAHLMGGTLTVQSDGKNGTCFTLSLPLHEPRSEALS